jgi:hypothetical protein
VLTAAEGVFAELYSDGAAFAAIEAAIPALRSSNPREIKRYVNLFRFYSFITFRRRIEGVAPDDAQLAKLAALAIRWPDLLGVLSKVTVVDRLERAAMGGDHGWEEALAEFGCLAGAGAAPRRAELRAFLTHGPKVGAVAHTLL